MARDLEHLPLPIIQGALPARKSRALGRSSREDRPTHGRNLAQQATLVETLFEQRVATAPRHISPNLIFRIQFNPEFGTLTEDQLQRLNLRVLAHDANKAVVVFPNEQSLGELRRRIQEYAGIIPDGHKYGELDAIEEILPLSPQDRIGSRLAGRPFQRDEVTYVDIELWHPGERQECRRKIDELTTHLRSRDLSVTDFYIGDSLCLVRARVDYDALHTLLNTDFIKEVDRRPEPSFDMLPAVRLTLTDLEVNEVTASDGLTGVLIIDSGVATGHPLIGPALGDAQVFPDSLRQRVRGGAEDGDTRTGGHGTAVAGIAIYNDIGKCIEQRFFEPTAQLFSARVTDDNNEYDERELLEHQLANAVRYFIEAYPSLRVINISLGDRTKIYYDGMYQFRLAAAIDSLAYQYRDREILFVISSGNYWPRELSDEQVMDQYPGYLLRDTDARVCDPATAALALTVGGLSFGPGRDLGNRNEALTNQAVAGESGWPSPFTRVGFGVDGALKPELVDFAGDLRFEQGRIYDQQPQYAGVTTISRDFAPPDGRLFRFVSGTSFAAPRVANLAARLFREFPGASSNLVRALIASSARLPASRPGTLADGEPDQDDVLRIYGYGQPNFERARWSSEQEVLLTADDVMDVDTFRLYEIPALPTEFLTSKGSGLIGVTLAFDPPTRHTRADSYLGITMEAHLFRNLTSDQVADVLREWAREERAALGDGGRPPSRTTLGRHYGVTGTIRLSPGVNLRKKGTLQRGWARVSSSRWTYDGTPLVLAVICKRKWAPQDITRQRFAVVATLAHENEQIQLHSRIREQIRQQQRVRIHV